MIGEWNSEDDIATARPKMIAFLDTLRHTLEELSSDLGVTDPHSLVTVVIETLWETIGKPFKVF